MAFIEENHIDEVADALDDALNTALEMIGIKVEKYAKNLAPTGTPESTGIVGYRGGTLKNSITHQVNEEEKTLEVGSNVEYAPYVELGTGPNFKAPPEWEEFDVPTPSGLGHSYVKPRPFLRPAIEEHISLYENIIKDQLS